MSTPQPPSGLVVPASMVTATWIKVHEKFLIVLMVLLFGSLGLHHFLFNQAAAATQKVAVLEATLSSQKAQDAVNAATMAQVQSQYQSIVQSLTAQNSALAAATAQRTVVLQARQTENATLPLPELANRLQVVGNIAPKDISVAPGGVLLTQPGVLAAVNTLETVPVLRSNLNDEKQIATNLTDELAKGNALILAQGTQITGLNVTLADQTKACTAEVAAVKKRGRLQSFRWFMRGFFLGVASGLYAGHAL
jgi:hypothetical protein